MCVAWMWRSFWSWLDLEIGIGKQNLRNGSKIDNNKLTTCMTHRHRTWCRINFAFGTVYNRVFIHYIFFLTSFNLWQMTIFFIFCLNFVVIVVVVILCLFYLLSMIGFVSVVFAWFAYISIWFDGCPLGHNFNGRYFIQINALTSADCDHDQIYWFFSVNV